MGKASTNGPASTINGAAVRRAVHVRYERPPVLDDDWVPIDFETTTIALALASSSHDPSKPSTVSWLNTIAYLTVEATVESVPARTIVARRV